MRDLELTGAVEAGVRAGNVHVSSKQAEASQAAWCLAPSDIVVDQVIP